MAAGWAEQAPYDIILIEGAVAEILAQVASRGDAAVADFTRRFDGTDLTPAEWGLPLEACHEALARRSAGGT